MYSGLEGNFTKEQIILERSNLKDYRRLSSVSNEALGCKGMIVQLGAPWGSSSIIPTTAGTSGVEAGGGNKDDDKKWWI